jgi:hypothetical protein
MAETAISSRKKRSFKRLGHLVLGGLLLPLVAASASAQTTAHGLLGQYFSWDPSIACPPDQASVFTPANQTGARIDPNINFGAAFNTPGTTSTSYGVEWTGFVQVPTSGTYQFTTRSDDGIRLWIAQNPTDTIDPSTIGPDIDAWLARGVATTDDPPVSVTLDAGKKYPIVILYVQCGGGAGAQLRYITPDSADGVTSEIVPSDVLIPPTLSDTTPPSAISDLAATNVAYNSATLTFTAPGDDGTTGTATGYEIRYSTSPINASNFASQPAFDISVHPKAAGSAESVALPLSAVQGYYVAVAAVDEAGNVGAISNVVNFQTPDFTYPTLPAVAAADKAVYYDSYYEKSDAWTNDANAQQIRDYFVGKGYKELDANGLADFMTAHAQSKTPSLVISALDVLPDTVIDLSSGAVTNKNIINDYLNNGGRFVAFADIPFYNIVESDQTIYNPADAGSTAILGFYAGGGTWDKNDATSITPVGAAFGLTSTWSSVRPANPADVDVTLESAAGGAAAWMKFFPDKSGPGFFARFLDNNPGANPVPQAILDDAQRVGEFSGTIVAAQGRLNGQILDGQGAPVAGAVLQIKDSTGKVTNINSDASGNYSLILAPETYTMTGTVGSAYGIKNNLNGSGPVTITAGKVTTGPSVTATPEPLPTMPAIAAADKAVYYDPTYGTGGWVGAGADAIDQYFTAAGYKELDAAGLADFMKSHAQSKTPSVVVMPTDLFPETVVDISSGAVTKTNIINDYMNNGGRVVYFGDVPFYNIAKADATNYSPGDNGGITILGFSRNGNNDANYATTPSPVGAALGLKSSWTSQRPTDAGNVDIVLEGGTAGADGWLKLYPDNTGTGAFIRLADTGSAGYTEDLYADAQKLAEFSGNFPTPTPSVKLGDINSDNNINVQDATLALRIAVGLLTPSDAQKTAADVNKDTKVNVQDATLILRFAVGLINSF